MTDAPSPYRPPSPPEPIWRWRLLDSAGAEVQVPATSEYADQRFPSQGDAETWVGEFWRELAELGVTGVVLLEGEREIYGPMSLEA